MTPQHVIKARLAACCATIAARGASEYLKAHNLTADPAVLAACLRSWVHIKLPEALADSKAALDCHMGQVAEATFAATMMQAGIEAAKEASRPKSIRDPWSVDYGGVFDGNQVTSDADPGL